MDSADGVGLNLCRKRREDLAFPTSCRCCLTEIAVANAKIIGSPNAECLLSFVCDKLVAKLLVVQVDVYLEGMQNNLPGSGLG